MLALRARLWIRLHPRAVRRIREQGAWIFGGAVGRAFSDNSAALFRHVRRTRPRLPAYWAIDRDSPDVEAARAVGPVLFRDDHETFVRALLADVHVISHGIHDVPGCASAAARAALKVRLGHGLTALKRTTPRAGHDLRGTNAIFDLVPVASDFEKANKLDWEIDPGRLVVTGLARFDSLLEQQRRTPTDPRRIVYMPTWRDSADPAGLAEAMGRFLTCTELRALLERHGATIDVFLHRNLAGSVQDSLSTMAGGQVRFPDLSDPQPLFAASGLLVTDYSSVAWDMLYLDKPVLFYQFDRDRFEKNRGGYLEPERLPGPLARDASSLISRIGSYLSGDWRTDPDWQERMERGQARAFAFRDDGNCERIARQIEMRLEARAAGAGPAPVRAVEPPGSAPHGSAGFQPFSPQQPRRTDAT